MYFYRDPSEGIANMSAKLKAKATALWIKLTEINAEHVDLTDVSTLA